MIGVRSGSGFGEIICDASGRGGEACDGDDERDDGIDKGDAGGGNGGGGDAVEGCVTIAIGRQCRCGRRVAKVEGNVSRSQHNLIPSFWFEGCDVIPDAKDGTKPGKR